MRTPTARIPRAAAACALVLVALLAGCADWTGRQEVEFDDPYIGGLEAGDEGWGGRLGLFRRYAAVDRAFHLEEEGDWAEAAAEVGRYLELHPEDVRVRAYYLELLGHAGRRSRVIEEASTLLEREPTYVPALLARGRARAADGELEGAVDDLMAASRAPGIRPQDRAGALEDAVRFALARAQALEEEGRTAGAEAAYAAALSLPLDPDSRVRALRGQARMAAARGRLDTARAAVARAVSERPESVGLRLEAAGLAMRAGDYADAATYLETLLELDVAGPERHTALDQLAVAYERLGRPAEAAVRVEELLGSLPAEARTPALHVRAANLLEAAGRPIRAAEHLESAAARAGSANRVAYLRRAAGLYAGQGRIEPAVAALRAALAVDPSDAATRARLSEVLVLAAQPDHPERLGRLRQEAAAGPLTAAELTASRRSFARAYEATGQLSEARELWRQVAEGAEPGSPVWTEAVERLAALDARLGEPRRSADRLMELHRLAPDRPESREGRWALEAAERYAEAGAWPDAVTAYRAALDRGALTGVEGARRLGVALVEAGAGYEAARVLSAIPPEERTLQDYRYLAGLATEARDTARALELYRDGLAAATTAGDSARTLRAMSYLNLTRDDAAAVDLLTRSLELEPAAADAGVRTDLARARLRLGRPEAALQALDPAPAGLMAGQRLERLDLLAEIHAERGDTAAVIDVLEQAARLDPTAYRYNRLGFFYELVGRYGDAAAAFERAYAEHPSAVQAAQVAYAYRRVGDDRSSTDWFRRSIDAAGEGRGDTVDLDALRREVAVLTDRLSAALYSSFRGDGAAATPGGAVAQAGIGSQGGFQLMVRPLLGRTSWGRDVDVFGRFFWGWSDGLGIDGDSYQGQLGVRYRPAFLPGSAVGLERWIGLGDAALDAWAARVQLSRLLGRPYPEPGDGPAPYAALYGDAAWLMDRDSYLAYAEARPGLAIPVAAHWAVLPHATGSVYHQDLDGLERSYLEAGPGLGLRFRVPRDGRYTRSFWTLELLTQYRWGRITGGGAPDDAYDELVLTLVLQF